MSIDLFSAFSSILGGLGLFLVGMWLMTDGLKLAAGNALRELLQVWTNSRLRGLITGFSITALVQSSSAVTVATIGFVNAGLLTLERAVWVLFGSNVGTTMTGWLVVLVGFNLNVEAYALPLIGIGMLVRLSGLKTRRAAMGQAIVGFGLFFLGIGVLKDAFMDAGTGINLPGMDEAGVISLVLYVLIGFALTTLMQSSSAAMVVTLSAAEGGLIPLSAAAAAVIGGNLGTTTKALLAVWGATADAKRVACGHVLFNLVTAFVAIIIMAPMLMLVGYLQEIMNLPPAPATTLALFHTVFNVMGVMIMWPLAGHMIDSLKSRFVSHDEIESKPKYLDHTILEVPALAVSALRDELNRVSDLSIRIASDAMNMENVDNSRIQQDNDNLELLAGEIGNYVARMSQADLPAEIADRMPEVILTVQEYVTVANLACEISELQGELSLGSNHESVLEGISMYKQEAANLLQHIVTTQINFDRHALEERLKDLEKTRKELRLTVLKAATRGLLRMVTLDALLQQANLIRSMVRRYLKASGRLQEINRIFGREQKAESGK